jgi:hypothetical protein
MVDSSGLNSITISEHISPEATGDNIGAKRTANYYWDGSNWQRLGAGLVPTSYDYIAYTSGTTTDTYVYKTGGVSGTTTATITVTWTDSNKTTLSSVART